ncbi:MAG: cysteine--tRNA ligase [Chloroflexi bacterium]|nr:cysteine--tRNA ligase [Chloroflexota bacterium]
MQIYDTLDKKLKDLNSNRTLNIYICGITPYSESHIGHAMSAVIFDTLRRYLLSQDYKLKFVQNFTDIDDKLINVAKEKNTTIDKISNKYISQHLNSLSKLNVMPADHAPKATEEIKEMINMIEALISKEMAYEINGDCYFRVNKFDTYGKLSKRNTDEMLAGARIDINENKEHPMDFALWKKQINDEPGWESPWGNGRPGWHIECSAMSMKYLGQNLDIHGGGRDLIFPHHENEIAQSEGFSDNPPFSNIWMHNGLINLKSEKMSKSIGNIISIDDLLKKYSAAAIRMFFISGNYKNPLEYDDAILISNEKAINRLKQTLNLSSSDSLDELNPDKFINKFNQSMSKDLNTSLALGSIFEMSRSINQSFNKNINISKSQLALAKLLNILGIDTDSENESNNNLDTKEIEDLINLRNKHRLDKDYKKADEIRDKLEAMGIAIYDSDDGTKWRNI